MENKNYQSLRIIFMGTPDFAVASLSKLVEEGCNIVAVITAPDKPAGRGMELQRSAVKKYALEKGFNILQPEKLKNEVFINELKNLIADMQVVVAFRMLPEVVWNMPLMGTINVHGSLLPNYRGAAPINWAIINGEKYTGVTTFKLQQEIDTGDILLSQKIEIKETDTFETLYNELKEIGANLLLRTIKGIADKSLKEVPQSPISYLQSQDYPHAPKLTSETGKIHWTKSVEDVYNLIRGLSPYPSAYSTLNNKKIKIFTSEKIKEVGNIEMGEYRTDGKNYLQFACSNGFISILSLQMEGKKRMDIKDFLRGYRF